MATIYNHRIYNLTFYWHESIYGSSQHLEDNHHVTTFKASLSFSSLSSVCLHLNISAQHCPQRSCSLAACLFQLLTSLLFGSDFVCSSFVSETPQHCLLDKGSCQNHLTRVRWNCPLFHWYVHHAYRYTNGCSQELNRTSCLQVCWSLLMVDLLFRFRHQSSRWRLRSLPTAGIWSGHPVLSQRQVDWSGSSRTPTVSEKQMYQMSHEIV